MLEGKFKCVNKVGNVEGMTVGKIYNFINGRTIWDEGCPSGIIGTIEQFNRLYNFTIEPYVEPDQPKILSNSELWKLAEQNLIPDGTLFQFVGEGRMFLEGDIRTIRYSSQFGEFRWKNKEETAEDIQFDINDKWIQLPSKPRMSKAQAEIEFGIQIID